MILNSDYEEMINITEKGEKKRTIDTVEQLTNELVRERISRMGFVARSNVLEADKAASYIVKMMYRGTAVIIPRWTIRLSYAIGSILPFRLLLVLLGRLFKGVG
jgi:hypothetical protein